MGLIVDTSVLISTERRGQSVRTLLASLRDGFAEDEISISSVSVVELTHGIYRARTPRDAERRRLFVDDACAELSIEALTVDIARLAGQIEGEQAAIGNTIAFEDLVIGATALYLDFRVATHNVRHFEKIPRLGLVTPDL